MIALGLESILVSDVGDAVDNAIGASVRELATHCINLVISASVLQDTIFLRGDTVGGLHSEGKNNLSTLH